MTRPFVILASGVFLFGLAACEPVPGGSDAGAARPVTVPEAVAEVAAPFQDLSTARIRAQDGCYWYTHDGPVENVELPLRTSGGNPICTRPQS